MTTTLPSADDPRHSSRRVSQTAGASAPALSIPAAHVRSLKAAGFKTICFIGDHGQSQDVQKDVALRLTREWEKAGVRVMQVGDYYAVPAQTKRLQSDGLSLAQIGQHASIIDTSELMAVHPKGVDLARYRKQFMPQEQSGVYGNPAPSTEALGADLIRMRIEAAVRQIKANLAGPGGKS